MNQNHTDDSAINVLRHTIAETLDPFLNLPIGDHSIKQLSEQKGVITGIIERPYPCTKHQVILDQALQSALQNNHPSTQCSIKWEGKIAAHSAQKGIPLLQEVRNIIAIASGKGGVGKSTTTINIALAMAQEGARVGILDADIYGPSIPQMMGLADKHPEADEKQQLQPLENHGVQSMSIGYMIDVETPMIWRGPMVVQALDQLIRDTAWKDLDYLFVDMPPGTGDIQLSLAQKVPLTGAVIVTTPQDIALLDARKGLKMFEKVSVPILGLVENMSYYCCPKCEHNEPIFGEGGAEKMGSDYQLPVLGKLPLQLSIRAETDSGRPTVISSPNTSTSETYHEIAHKIAIAVAKQAKNYNAKIPNIVIQNT